MRRQRQIRGFTLIEVMVALAIVSLSLTAIMASMSQMIDAANSLRNRTYASWIAQNRIAELRLSDTTPNVGATNGEVEYASAEWAWRAVVAETGVEDLYRIDVAVTFAGSEDVIRTVTGFVGPPGSIGEANRIMMWVPTRPPRDAPSPDPEGSES